MIRHLFAYGTLISGVLDPAVEHLVAHACRPRGEALLPGRLYDLGGYPGALPHAGPGRVRGVVLELLEPDRCLPVFDLYEAYDPTDPSGSEYRREPVQVELNGQALSCWVYWLNQVPPDAPLIPGGDWFAH